MKFNSLTIFILLSFLFCFATPQVYAQHDLSDDAKAHYDKGQDHYKAGRYDEAILEFKDALEHDPNDAASLFGLGNSYFLKQDFAQAIKCYEGVTKIKPDFPKAHYALALAYRRIGKTEEAEKEFDLYNRLSSQKPLGGKPSEAPKRAEAPKPAARKIEPKKETTEGALPERPAVKRIEAPKEVTEEAPTRPATRPRRKEIEETVEKRALPEEVLKKARPAEREEKVGAERPLTRREATRPPVTIVKKPEAPAGNFISRWISGLWSGSPLGKLFVALITYTFMVQVWIGIVVLLSLVVLWRRR